MLSVELDHILSEEDVAQKIQDILTQVELNGEMYVITKDSRPVAAIVNINQLSGTAQASAVGAASAQTTVPVDTTVTDNAQIVPDWNESPAVPDEAISEPELPQMPPLSESDTNLAVPPPIPQAPPMPDMSPVDSEINPVTAEVNAPTQAPAAFDAPTTPSMPTYSGGNSPLAEEPPEDVEGALIPQIPVIQNPPTNLPPLSGEASLQDGNQSGQSYGVPDVPQP